MIDLFYIVITLTICTTIAFFCEIYIEKKRLENEDYSLY